MTVSSWTHRRVGDFEIEERIGRGGFAAVYRARQHPVNRMVALKIIDLDEEENADAYRRFQQEAQVVASLEHIHILPIYDYGVVEDRHAYFVTRLMSRSLNDMLRDGSLPLAQAAKISIQIGSALGYAHAHGVTHRDIKPSNILLDDAGNAYLSDFGLARRATPLDEIETGIVGTPSYIAPEILLGKPADHLSDIYSFGVVMYHMLTGRVPFEVSSSSNIAGLFYKHVQQPPTPPRALNPAIPPGVEKVILRALAKNPQERFLSVVDMMQDFEAEIDLHVLGRRRPLRLPSSNVFVGVILAVLAVIIVVSAWELRSSDDLPTAGDVQEGMRGQLGELTLTDEEVARARAALGEDGYIAYLACSLDTLWQTNRARELSTMGDALGVPVRVYDAGNDPYTQSTQVEQARIEGARAVILCPVDPDIAVDMGQSLADSEVPLAYTTLIDFDYGVKLDPGNYTLGEQVGSFAASLLLAADKPEGRIVLLNVAGFSASTERIRGMLSGLWANAPGANIIAAREGFTAEDAYASVSNLIAEGIHFDAVLSVSDAGTPGAIRALEEAGLTPDDVFIISVGGDRAILDALEQGRYVRGVIAVNSEEGSRLLLSGIIKLLAGSAVPEILAYTTGQLITTTPVATATPSG